MNQEAGHWFRVWVSVSRRCWHWRDTKLNMGFCVFRAKHVARGRVACHDRTGKLMHEIQMTILRVTRMSHPAL